MGLKKDYTDQKIGRLRFLSSFKVGAKNFWNVECDCGLTMSLRCDYISILKSKGKIFECTSCKLKRRSPVELNSKYGRLTVIKEIPAKDHHRWFLCLCECGNYTEVPGVRLCHKKKPTRSCGCWARKIHSKWANTTQYPPAHGFKKNTAEKTLMRSLYNTRNSILKACFNDKDLRYKNYGKKNITMCDLWRNGAKEFVRWALENGYKKGYSIVLKEGKLEFNPLNCIVIPKCKIYYKTNSKFIEFKGIKKSISEWASELGCSMACLSIRLKKYKDYGMEKIMDLNWIPPRTRYYGTEHFEKNIVDLYSAGSTFKEVSEKLGCSTSTINRFLIKNKISKRPAKRRSLLIDAKMPNILTCPC